MAITQLELYNNALQLIGQRRIQGLTVDEDTRYHLDSAYNAEAIAYCLELSKPVFATKTIMLDTSVVSNQHDLDNVFTLPTDYITTVGLFSDSKLDEPINRYVQEKDTLACEHATIYLRYITNDPVSSFTNWTPSFSKLFAAYLAKEICPKVAPTHIEEISTLFVERLKGVVATDESRKIAKRPTKTATTLSSDWIKIYNDALLLLGKNEITSGDDESDRRVKLDRALDAGIVEELLEDYAWSFATTSEKVFSNPNLNPDWGYTYAHDQPAKMHRYIEVFSDEQMETPLTVYRFEDDKFWTDIGTIYIEFISTDYLYNPALWPAYFKRLVAARLSKAAAIHLNPEASEIINLEYAEREARAKKIDKEQQATKGRSGSFHLTEPWKIIYNDALMIMGLDEITSITDDSNRKVKMDRVVNAGIIRELLEDYQWLFATVTARLDYNQAISVTDKGYSYGFDKPGDILRLAGLYADERLTYPVRLYHDEGAYYYCDYQTIYIEYIRDTFADTASSDSWPSYFRRLVAAKIARDASPSLRDEGADYDNSRIVMDKREREAKNNDAMISPPKIFSEGSWVKSRTSYFGRRDRP